MNTKTQLLITNLIDKLNKNYDYVILRNYEMLPESLESRDIDILLNPEQLISFQSECVNVAELFGFKIIYTYWDSQMWTIVFGYVDEVSVELIQLDVLVNLNVLGIIFLDWRQTLSKKIYNGRLFHLPLVETFLAKFVYSTVLGAAYPNKYNNILNEVKKSHYNEINTQLQYLLDDNQSTLDYWLNQNNRIILLKGFLASLKRQPIMQIITTSLFLSQYIFNLFYQRGLFITISGPDGSGKTTIINLINEHLSKINPPINLHYRPKLIPNISDIGIKFNLIKNADRRYHIPHRSKKNGIAQSCVRLLYYLSDYIFGYYFKILPMRWRKHIIIFDRYYTDLVSDGERASIFLNYKFIYSLIIFVPTSYYNFIIKADKFKILSRKNELTPDAIEEIYVRLNYICERNPKYYSINNNDMPEDAVLKILKIVFNMQNHEYLKRIKRKNKAN